MIKKRRYIKNRDGIIKTVVYTIEYEGRNYEVKYSGKEHILSLLEQQGMDPLSAYRYSVSIKSSFPIEQKRNSESAAIINKVKEIIKRK